MLYNPSLYIPQHIADAIPKKGKMKLTISEHAKEQASKRGFTLPLIIDFANGELFEVEVKDTYTGTKLTKIGYRYKYDESNDLCIIINTFNAVIVTAWLNNRFDLHSTLLSEKYARR